MNFVINFALTSINYLTQTLIIEGQFTDHLQILIQPVVDNVVIA